MSTPLPPLVEPAAELTREEVARYSRHLIIPDVGLDGQKRLKNARVLVIGAGGLGSPTLLYLAAAGVGTIGIVEFDLVDESNLQRQIIHGQSDIGRSKAQSAKDSIAEINPLVNVVLHEFRLEPDNAVDLFAQYDLILDGTDNFATRYLVNDAAVLAGKPYVWGSIYRFEGQISVFWEDAPADEAGNERGLNYRDLYPEPPPPGMVPSCAEGGVLGILCASVGSVMGTEAIKLITGIGETLLGRLMVYDALDMTYRTIKIRKDPSTPKITELIDYEAFCGVVSDAAAEAAAESTITPRELRELMDSGKPLALIDVREPVEWDINHIEGAELIPKGAFESGEALSKLKVDRTPVFYCKTGIRSAEVLAIVKKAGFSDAMHVQGGIVAWGKQLEPDMVMY
ncbi:MULTISPECIES: adenylyltransferase/sulfurtransferase MoeZ [Mycolicibacterium]|uniref:Probable adenylyltransferase/sulfurtransferase MoeZ n=1 Tax=Mycolicibacterium vanbaalenii (strain DSM 7251 / JCM 13017 / BCRC 16820 / KCTC 9966 / NRRL B-24157 / PYR-1) TaxID=350058 RepID=A1T619_MYCVP|nr:MULTISPECIES: adenylyltransferase/sulfurtransferase MoeZ [Mycolicibacterium]ABM12619.1 UBA/THIF-type NAD/FAD binding protein [Mycolicibacterium vanbaalenii PYR-1]MCV7130424.1 adenylyltransferase/sulfurtransferase MoeZ [Mycolicibacterium vanbaalenii PYR-1]MDW5611951.1 adenylyltransferase/sulfurtransferase MoeZ [Mycolicibacterium sp. D5.8-2]PQP47148.1 adenylyltransferase/sulfurtransferase MoeZ [Mycolicibacterium austroafricanum]QZY47859.1 adenylyltransferase/sulfurtransferase MoeZ [Mycoliciba